MFKKTVTLLGIFSFIFFADLKAQLPETVKAETLEGTTDMNEISLMDHSFIGTIGRSPAVLNGPADNSWWSMINIRHRTGNAVSDRDYWGTQIAIGMTGFNDRMFFRGQYNGAWLTWQEVYTAATVRVRINNAIDDGVSPLQVNGNTTGATFIAKQNAGPSGNVLFSLNNAQGIARFGIGYTTIEGGGNIGSDFAIYSYSDAGTYLRSNLVISRATGNVGIGTANPQERLSVDGTVLAKKVKVSTAAANWPDYVFHKSYQLPSLYEIENFISQHQHLPGIPSAADIAENGQDLGDMDRKLLQKIEELTLYIINQQKQLEEQKKAQDAQQAEIARLRSLLESK